MASDNVKIIIQEVNETTPRGSGTSSDVAYVPGLAVEEATSKNVPVLCSTISEFESYFGKEPYVMTDEDIRTQIDHTYQVGDYDKSYLYAKELINAGMSVIYENITSTTELKNIAIINNIPNASGKNLVDNKDNTFTYRVTTRPAQSERYDFKFKLTGKPAYGAVTVLFDLPEVEGVTIVPSDIVHDHTDDDIFEIDQETRTISWSGIEQTDLDYTTFSFYVDISCVLDKANYTFGVNVVNGRNVKPSGVAAGSKIEYLYNQLNERLNNIEDKNEYSVKYITSGGYPTFIELTQDDGSKAYSLADAMIDCAMQRGDAVAIIDPIDDPEDPLRYNDENSVYYKANVWFGTGANNSFGAMFIPCGTYTCVTVTDINKMSQLMPPSFGYLMCVATAIKTSPNWLAMAGVTRGIVPNLKALHTNSILSNVIAEDYQPKYGKDNNKVSINAITNVKPYGLAIWGNRTLEPVAEKGTTALNFLNTRNMVSDIKKLAYSTAKSLMFEQDSDTLWLNFKSGVSPLLDQLKSGHGISNYKIIKGTTKYNGQPLTRGEMAAVIKIYPLYAIEYFEITVVIADEDVSVQ